MAAGQVIGRVSVKVMPDTGDFRRDAERKLSVIEKQLRIEIGTTIDMSGASREFLQEVRKINQRNRVLDSRKIRFHTTISTDGMREAIARAVRQLQSRANNEKIKIRADLVAATADLELSKDSLDDVERQLDRWRRRVSPVKVRVHPDLTLGAFTVIEKRLDYLTRPRRVPIFPTVNTGALAKAAAALGALSGARLAAGYIRDLARQLMRLDKAVPLIGTLALAIAGLAGWGLSAASNLAALSVSLASIAPAALVLPGILGGLAIGLATTVVVFKDFKKVLPEVKAQLGALQKAMSVNFWAVAKQPIKDLVATLLPQLSAGLRRTATDLGGFFGSLARSLSGAFNGVLAGMFADLSSSIAIASTGTRAYAGILATLGQVGAGYLPRLAQWFVDIANRFDAWLSATAADGRLKAWIDTGLTALADLGGVLTGLVRIFAGVGKAATEAGGSTLSSLSAALNSIADTVNGPVFQTLLVGVFRAAHQAMDLIATTSGPAVSTMFATLATTLQTILPLAGAAIGTLLKSVAEALSQPALQTGLTAMFTGLKTGIDALAPAFGPIGAALGALASLIGTFAASVGPVLATLFTALASAISTVAPALQPLVTVLAGGLGAAFTALAPALQQVVAAFSSVVSGGLITTLGTALSALGPVVAALAPAIGGLLASAVKALAPILAALVPLITQVASIVGGFLAEAFTALAPVLTLIGQTLGALVSAVAPLITALLSLVMAVLRPLLDAVIKIVTAALPPLRAAIEALVPALMPVINAIAAVVTWLAEKLAPVITFIAKILVESLVGAINGVTRVFRGAVDIVMGIWNTFAGLFTGDWGRMWNGIKQLFSGVWDLIVGIVQTALNIGVLGLVKKGLALIKGIWTAAWDGIKVAATTTWAAIRGAWSGFLEALKAAPGAAVAHIKGLFTGLWGALKSGAAMAWSAVRTAFITGAGNAIATIRELPGRARAVLGNIGSVLINAGRQLIAGLINGIRQMFGHLKGVLGDLTSKLKDWKGPPATDRTLLVGAGQLLIDGLIDGLESRYDAVRRSLAGLTADIGGLDIPTPTIGRIAEARLAARLRCAADAASGQAPPGRVLNYYAAPGTSLSAEEDLFEAAGRARMVGW
ncbi:hypothetical protein GCM10010124_02280 [Pilimelia terevasa]|uniref:Tape measure protein n=2 Tax=Pilimelia terevasa TaxID=53372 RepID=A0A8J3BGG9_9ACTN|nr:hypothetical protein GCM10010124_02280 [Pilimelia terevasa]